jgi:tetratricopeptide (TPR) repeat protein
MRIALVFFLSLACAAALAAPMQPQHARGKSPLDALFQELARAGSPEEAKPIEDRIFALFEQSGSPTVDLLMARGAAAMAVGDGDAARKLFDAVTEISPRFAEAWHERAQLLSDEGDDEAAMISLQKTVTLNPRQFAAMTELGDMLEEYGDKAGALKMYRRALALDPQLEGAAKRAKELERDVEGRGI